MLKYPKLHSGITTIDEQWGKLVTKLQKYVEHHPVTNASGGALAKGDIVRADAGVRQAVLALADSEAHAEWIGVLDGSPVVAAGAKTDMATSNVQLVRFVDALTLVEGTPCYLSEVTAGAASNALPATGFVIRVGIIVDASMYVTLSNHYALVLLGRCCTPTEVQN